MNSLSPTATAVTTDHRPDSVPLELQEGIGHVLREREAGRISPLAGWLGDHPGLAGELGRFLAAERGLKAAVASMSHSTGPPALVGRYELGEEIGRGGMGVVYRAYDALLKREVALKLMLAGPFRSAEERAGFLYEANAVASLNHPGILPVHDLGESGGAPYLVMPIMTRSLATWLKSLGPDRCLQPKHAARLILDLASAMQHAHQRAILHRDLKPGNILLDGEDRPYVADFGLARRLDESMSGGVAGTAAYMAPEQANGDKVLTTAVDIHALGAILFELLTGSPPFGMGESLAVMRQVIENPVPAVRSRRQEVPADLEAICQRCLQKDAGDRYSSCGELAENLERFLNDEPIVGRRQRSVITSLRRAVSSRRETASMLSWPTAFWGAASTLLAMAVIQSAVLFDAPSWVANVGLGYYLVGWAVILWGFLVVRRRVLNPVERGGTALQFGTLFGAAALIPTQLWLHDGSIASLFQPLLVVVTGGVYAHGIAYWGRLYLIGLLLFAVAAAMPLVPVVYWPGVYGLALVMLQMWIGFVLRHFDRRGRAEAERWREPAP